MDFIIFYSIKFLYNQNYRCDSFSYFLFCRLLFRVGQGKKLQQDLKLYVLLVAFEIAYMSHDENRFLSDF